MNAQLDGPEDTREIATVFVVEDEALILTLRGLTSQAQCRST